MNQSFINTLYNFHVLGARSAHGVPSERRDRLQGCAQAGHGGRRLLVSAGLIALAFFVTILIVTYESGRGSSLDLLIGDYIVTLGIAIPE